MSDGIYLYIDNLETHNSSEAVGADNLSIEITSAKTTSAASTGSGATISISGGSTPDTVTASANASGETLSILGESRLGTVTAIAEGIGGSNLILEPVLKLDTAQATATGGQTSFDVLGRNGEINVYIDGTRIDSYQEMEIEQRLNEPDTFSFTAFIVEDSQRGLISQGNDIIITEGYNLLFKGRLEEVNYDTAFQAKCEGEGMETKLLDRKTGRDEYLNTPGDDIVRDIAPTDTVTLGTIEDAPTTSIRFDHDNKARGVAGVANAVGYDWRLRQEIDDNYDTDYLDFIERLGSETPVETFTIGETARLVDDGGDDSFVANDITLLGRGDGINQLEARVYSASEEFTQLSSDLSETGTTVNVDDTSVFGATGDNVVIKAGVELIDADIVDSTTLSVNTRGVTNFEGEETEQILHRENLSVWLYENVTQELGPFTPENQDSAQTGSSIATKGVKQLRETDKTIIKLPTLEIIADRELRNRYEDVKQIEVRPTDPRIASGLELGDTITIEDGLGAGTNGDFRIVGMDHKRRTGGEGTVLHCANRPRRLVERLSEIERDKDTLNAHMQGATNFNGESFGDNCDNTNPIENQIYIPEDVVAVNKIALTFNREKFRGYTESIAESSSETGEWTNKAQIIYAEDSDFSDAFVNVEAPESPTGEDEGVTVTATAFNQSSSVGRDVEFELTNETTNTTLKTEDDFLDSNSLRTYNYNFNSSEVSSGDVLELTLNTILGTDAKPAFNSYIELSVDSKSSHDHNTSLNYGMFRPGSENNVDIDVEIDGQIVDTVTDFGVGDTLNEPIRVEDHLDEPIAGEWHDIRLIPKERSGNNDDGLCRLSADIIQKVFIESTL